MEKTDTSSRNSGLRQASAVSAAVLPAESMLSISAVERDTGLSKDVLRMWERRYRFPSPLRDKHGERIYPHDQIAKLRAVKRLMDRGYRPGKIIGLHLDDLNALGTAPAGALEHSTEIQEVLSLIRGHQLQELRQRLNQMLMKQGLLRFVVETVAPLTTAVGEAWVRGEFAVFEEHLYTEQIQGLLRNAITSAQAHSTAPRVLLTSFPTEPHNLGLLMVEAALVVEGATCIPLGTETPAPEIVRAASAHRADIVALSFSAAFPERLAASGLRDLRLALPRNVELWAGGSCVRRLRKAIEGVALVRSLDQLGSMVADWRAVHGPG
ncbi:MAG: MerR family transcriptional regulator [Betaproteobacteria bacterium]|jgi:DNA-binding transcriptional MerR regulator|nr:MerR family transcriptional regulator [Betaproteobacteria bacterium]